MLPNVPAVCGILAALRLRSKDQGWQNVSEQGNYYAVISRREGGYAADLAGRNPGADEQRRPRHIWGT
jgi:hypothetical protein